MFSRRSPLGFLIALLAAFVSLGAASLSPEPLTERDTTSTASTFVYPTDSGNLTFALTAVKSNGDLYFHMEAPAGNSWVAIGTGDSMSGSVMFLIYASSDGKGVTLSPRYSSDEVEPSYNSKLNCQLANGTGIINGIINYNKSDIYVVNGHCSNIPSVYPKALDFGNTQQKFIFAVGPSDHTIHSNDLNAGIRRHTEYGTFQMDMTKATVQNADDVTVPTGPAAWQNSANSKLVGHPTNDHDWTGPIHALAMCGAFVIMFPAGVIILRVMEKVKLHAGMQGLATLVALIGVGIGVYLSRMYNHSKNISSAHQIVGLVLLFACFAQFALGYFHHRIYKQQQRSTIMGKIHRYAGPVILILGALNGFLGFSFSDNSKANIFYAVIIVVVFGLVGGLLFWKARRKARQAKASFAGMGGPFDNPPRGYQGAYDVTPPQGSGYSTPYDPSRSNIALGNMPSHGPPGYNETPTYPRPMV